MYNHFFSGTPVMYRALFLFASAIFMTDSAYSGVVGLNWDATTNATGYKVYYGQAPGNYTATIDVGNVLSSKVTNLQAGTTYYIAVKAYSGTKESVFSNEVSAAIPTATAPTVNFSASTSTANAPVNITFTPTVTGTVTDWSWNFDDGSTNSTGTTAATLTSTTHSFSEAGVHNVTLTANSGAVSKVVPITIKPVAGISTSATTGVAPLKVNFTDGSSGFPDAWSWKVANGSTAVTSATTSALSYTFSAPGTYTVSLNVSGNGVSSANTASQTITVSAPVTTGTTSGSTGNQQQLTGSGLVAAYSFEEAVGNLVADASGLGNTGSVLSARWTTATGGKYGKALYFNGSNAWVNVPDSTSLHMAQAMTLEAWVYPLAGNSGWREIFEKGDDDFYLVASSPSGVPASAVQNAVGEKSRVAGQSALPQNTWTFLALTNDGTSLCLYQKTPSLNADSKLCSPFSGTPKSSTGALGIGGDALYGQFFNGYLDELRIYNRALSATELAYDMNNAISSVAATKAKALLGTNTLSSTYLLPKGIAYAYPVKATKSGVITATSVYVDKTSQSNVLAAAIYASDSSGKPGTRLAKGAVASTALGQWNSIALPATKIVKDAIYWVAVLSPNAQLVVGGASPTTTSTSVETSPAGTMLSSLPGIWTSGGLAPAATPLIGYGAGY